MDTEDFLPSANRLTQKPAKPKNDVHSSSGTRFSNQTQGPRNYPNQRYSNPQHSGNHSFQKTGQFGNNRYGV